MSIPKSINLLLQLANILNPYIVPARISKHRLHPTYRRSKLPILTIPSRKSGTHLQCQVQKVNL